MSELSDVKLGTASSMLLYGCWCESAQSPLVAATLLQGPRISRTYQIVKRAMDICGALLGLVILFCLLFVIAPLIFIEDRGAIFYKQVRVGQDGRPFLLYKLRSMVMDADDYLVQHPELLNSWRRTGKLQINQDPRVTRIGRFLRQSSLDELPQMWNVLRGEMSLVGPRAIQFSEVAAFGELATLRQMVKPGLTGLWQIRGRSLTDYEQRAFLDCIYVVKCSFWIDLYILFKTLPAVICGVGAY
ncbi:MAG TPA: sugar transferase [Ktedonobacteraceae bacterium]|nr:sugar transferase [Ktedonobacteraceae bacterium]